MSELNFKARVNKFWSWFARNAQRFYETIEAGKCMDLAPEVGDACSHLFPGLAWVFGPGENGIGHSFTLTGEGDPNKQFLTSFWQSCAPGIEGWTFYSARPPSQLDPEAQIEVDGKSFGPGRILIQTTVSPETESVSLVAWHPEFAGCDEDLQYMILTLWLDEALGETGTQTWIGSVKMEDISGDPAAKTLLDLPEFIAALQQETKWEKLPPDQSYTMYKLPEPSDEFPRSDTIAGTTANMQLIGDFLDSAGSLEHVCPDTGADFVYLSIATEVFPKGNEVDRRGEIEDTLNDALFFAKSGRVFGGAMGCLSAYIDMVVFDGDESLQLVHKIMDDQGIAPGQYEIHSFAATQEA